MRYYNICRTGTIVCKNCNVKSQTPKLHLEHVNSSHPNIKKLCPFCQHVILIKDNGQPVSEKANHLKICCIIHKIENSNDRSLLNRFQRLQDLLKFTNEQMFIEKTPILELQTFQNIPHFISTMLEYERDEIVFEYENRCVCNDKERIPDVLKAPMKTIVQFFTENTVTTTNYPQWWCLDIDTLENEYDRVLYTNTLDLSSIGIDCRMIRILSLDWSLFKVIKINVPYNEKNLECLQNAVKKELLIISRYIHTYVKTNSTDIMISFLIILPNSKIAEIEELLKEITISSTKLQNFDDFVDTIFSMSSACSYKFCYDESCKHIDVEYEPDVFKSSTLSNFRTQLSSNLQSFYYNVYLTRLHHDVKFYIYSQTKYGCLRVYDRLLGQKYLFKYLHDAIESSTGIYLNYSSINLFRSNQRIFMKNGLNFAPENYQRDFIYKNIDSLRHLKIFFLCPNYFKMVIDAPTTRENETIYLPSIFKTMNIQYKLTAAQESMFYAIKYHRNQIISEINIIPNIDV